jgi:hypothetical protein
MAKQEKSVHKKSRGRPAGRLYRETIPVRLTPEAVDAIEQWIAKQPASTTRSEAIRRLIEVGLAASSKKR